MLVNGSRRVRGKSENFLPSEIVKAAWTLRNKGDGDLSAAIALLKSEGDASDEGDSLGLLKLLLEAERLAEFQSEICCAIARVSELRAGPSPEYLSYLLHAAEKACLLEYTDNLLKVSAPHCRNSPALRAAWAAVGHRQRYRVQHGKPFRNRASFISLGLHCLPWALLNRWGFRRESDFVLSFNPFCLSKHRIEAVVDALSNSFSSYCRVEDLRTTRTRNDHDIIYRNDRKAFWNHNNGPYWIKNNFAAFQQNMNWKIDNFRRICQRRNAIFLLGNCQIDYPEEGLNFLPVLKKGLRNQTGNADNLLIITNQQIRTERPVLRQVDDTTFFFNCPYPDNRYVWHDDLTADSREGLFYERSYIALVRRCLQKWGIIRQQIDASRLRFTGTKSIDSVKLART